MGDADQMIMEIGIKFPIRAQFGHQEHEIYSCIKQQIVTKFPIGNSLIVNMTWFGPQFDNGEWQKLQCLIAESKKFDRLFWLCIVDPVTLLPDQIAKVEQQLQITDTYYVGPAFAGHYGFNTHAIVCLEEFPNYSESDLLLNSVEFVYLNYNRKPKPHRIQLVEMLYQHQLEKYGTITLGKNDATYNVSQGLHTPLHLTSEDSTDYTRNGKFPIDRQFGGVPYDLCSLGNLDRWQSHFLNVVGETEFYPWDTVFVTEKTWKPIIGLRPFVINGQTTVYHWLRDNGFQTFNDYWPHIKVEDVEEFAVHDSIITVIKFLTEKTNEDLLAMYTDMLPRLRHNRKRFFEFAQEQKIKISQLLTQ